MDDCIEAEPAKYFSFWYNIHMKRSKFLPDFNAWFRKTKATPSSGVARAVAPIYECHGFPEMRENDTTAFDKGVCWTLVLHDRNTALPKKNDSEKPLEPNDARTRCV